MGDGAGQVGKGTWGGTRGKGNGGKGGGGGCSAGGLCFRLGRKVVGWRLMNTIKTPAWISPLARTGYAAKGVVYGIIGVMALLAAFGKGGDVLGSSGALRELASKPFGTPALLVTGVGLLAYSAYRLLCAFIDAEGEGEDGEGLAKRAGYFGSGAAYAALGIAALTGLGGGSGGEEEAASGVMRMTGGRFIVGAVGLAVMAAAIMQWVKAYTGSYRSKFTLDSLAAGKAHWINRSAKAGLISRGVVFLIMGGFLVLAAVKANPSKAMGLGEALGKLQEQSYGSILLGLTAAGLACYAIYCWVLAFYGNFGKGR